jgi:hypothetical protein
MKILKKRPNSKTAPGKETAKPRAAILLDRYINPDFDVSTLTAKSMLT